MFNSLFKSNDRTEDVYPDDTSVTEESGKRELTRQATLKILNTQIIYDPEYNIYDSVATCINENNQIETLSINGLDIDTYITSLIGNYIDYEVYEENGEAIYMGNIHQTKVL